MKIKFAKIYLVRHGDLLNPKKIITGYLPIPLNNKGKIQSRQAGLFLKDKNVSAIYSSPVRRTKETAQIINKIISRGKLKIQYDKNLRESGFGEFMRGMNRQDAEKKYPRIWYLYWHKPSKVKTGESLEKMAKRFLTVINKGIKKYPGQNLVFVSHRDPILAVLLKISKRSFDELHKVTYYCDKGTVLEVDLIGKRLVNKSF